MAWTSRREKVRYPATADQRVLLFAVLPFWGLAASLCQAILVVSVVTPRTERLLGLLLAGLQLGAIAGYIRTKYVRMLAAVAVLYLFQIAFSITYLNLELAFPLRLLQLVIVLCFLGSFVSVVLIYVSTVSLRQAVTVPSCVVLAALMTEAVVQFSQADAVKRTVTVTPLIRAMKPEADWGAVNTPNSTVTGLYQGTS